MSDSEKVVSKKISIIIPCYNCENTIDYCLSSIFLQTIGIDNMEIILVNDASTDNTLARLCEYEKAYPDTVMIINCTENGRQGRARNIALSYATGEFIAYSDDDDVMEPNMYEMMYKAAEQTGAEVVASVNRAVSKPPRLDGGDDELRIREILDLQSFDDRRKLLFNTDLNVAVWNKLYKRKFLIDYDIHFAENAICCEDLLFTMLMKLHVSKLCILDNVFYYHILTEQCASKSEEFNDRRMVDCMGVHAKMVEEFQNRGKYSLFQKELCECYINAYQNCLMVLAVNDKLSPELLLVMDDAAEHLFQGMLYRGRLHDYLKEHISKTLC